MKLSVEAKVAAAVAAGFMALTAVAIGQGGTRVQNGEDTVSRPIDTNLHVNGAYNGSLSNHRANTR